MPRSRTIRHTLTLIVTTPYADKAEGVENAINAALDEPPCDWGKWVVGAALVVLSEEQPGSPGA
jgi:hypothetical protein